MERVLPRAVLLSLWLEHLGIGAAAIAHATEAITGDDEPHTVVMPDGATVDLGTALSRWTRTARESVALLPAPGDSAALPAPSKFSSLAPGTATSITDGALADPADAIDAGECVLLTVPDGSLLIVPQVDRFGSDLEPGHFVTWRVAPCEPWRLTVAAAIGSLKDAERSLRTELAEAVDHLVALDISRWRDELVTELGHLRGDTPLPDPLPAAFDSRRRHILSTAWRLLAIAELASTDDGAAISSWESDERRRALLQVQTAARRAIAAATNSSGQ